MMKKQFGREMSLADLSETRGTFNDKHSKTIFKVGL